MDDHRTLLISAVLCVGVGVCGCAREDRLDDPFSTSDSTSAGTDTTGVTSLTTDTTSGASATETGGTTTGPATGGTGPKFDVQGPDGGSIGCEGGDGECGCSRVDLLFVIDNSGSMGSYQNALALAFPQFAGTLVTALPAGTDVHVGVTSTEMGYSSSGNTSIMNNVCVFKGDGDQPEDAFYITPDQMDTGRNGAQGRLYLPNGNGEPYFSFNTDGGAAELQALESWFTDAAKIGEGGSNIEMLTAPAGWAADPVNDATNAGFIRDEGSVMVVFFMQDEPDQTPLTVDGMATGTAMLAKLAAQKTTCGGVDCIVAGGFLNDNACGGRPIDEFLGGLPDQPSIAQLPNQFTADNDPAAAAAEMNQLLSDTLAEVIAKKCDEIPPVG